MNSYTAVQQQKETIKPKGLSAGDVFKAIGWKPKKEGLEPPKEEKKSTSLEQAQQEIEKAAEELKKIGASPPEDQQTREIAELKQLESLPGHQQDKFRLRILREKYPDVANGMIRSRTDNTTPDEEGFQAEPAPREMGEAQEIQISNDIAVEERGANERQFEQPSLPTPSLSQNHRHSRLERKGRRFLERRALGRTKLGKNILAHGSNARRAAEKAAKKAAIRALKWTGKVVWSFISPFVSWWVLLGIFIIIMTGVIVGGSGPSGPGGPFPTIPPIGGTPFPSGVVPSGSPITGNAIVDAAQAIADRIQRGVCCPGWFNADPTEPGVFYWCDFMVIDSYRAAGVNIERPPGGFGLGFDGWVNFFSHPGFQFVGSNTNASNLRPGNLVLRGQNGSYHVAVLKSIDVDPTTGNGVIRTLDSNNIVTEDVFDVVGGQVKGSSHNFGCCSEQLAGFGQITGQP
jgi:hypothetical protein